MTIDTLEICFRANMTELAGQLDALTQRLSRIGNVEIGISGIDSSASVLTSGLDTGGGILSDAFGKIADIFSDTAGSSGASAGSTPVHEKSKEINLTVPLVVDGKQLGEAAIRGINAVTRATGKLMLDI